MFILINPTCITGGALLDSSKMSEQSIESALAMKGTTTFETKPDIPCMDCTNDIGTNQWYKDFVYRDNT